MKDYLVQEVVLLNKLPIHLHKYLLPFFVLYAVGAAIWTFVFDSQRIDIALAVLATMVISQVLTVLSCFWSCYVRCLLTCSKVIFCGCLQFNITNKCAMFF